jgi:predicted GIY-YIG superfamily endonuclease
VCVRHSHEFTHTDLDESRQGRDAPAWVYVLGLKDGNYYVGSTTNPDQRIMNHKTGRGATVTRESGVAKVHSINECRSLAAAKRAEKKVYDRMRDYHGSDRVRGAGNTARFKLRKGEKGEGGRRGRKEGREKQERGRRHREEERGRGGEREKRVREEGRGREVGRRKEAGGGRGQGRRGRPR